MIPFKHKPSHSPNLRKWLNKALKSYGRMPSVYTGEGGVKWIGWLDDEDRWFSGCRISRPLCDGSKARIYAYQPSHSDGLRVDADFWDRYVLIGRCAIDELHRQSYIGDDTRWATNGYERDCLWCGSHKQRLRKWTEAINVERWESAA